MADSGLCLHDYAAGHLGMHSAEVGIFSGFGETELEFIVRIERSRFEFAVGAVDGVGNIIAVDPGDLRAGFTLVDPEQCNWKWISTTC